MPVPRAKHARALNHGRARCSSPRATLISVARDYHLTRAVIGTDSICGKDAINTCDVAARPTEPPPCQPDHSLILPLSSQYFTRIEPGPTSLSCRRFASQLLGIGRAPLCPRPFLLVRAGSFTIDFLVEACTTGESGLRAPPAGGRQPPRVFGLGVTCDPFSLAPDQASPTRPRPERYGLRHGACKRNLPMAPTPA